MVMRHQEEGSWMIYIGGGFDELGRVLESSEKLYLHNTNYGWGWLKPLHFSAAKFGSSSRGLFLQV